uniref:Uncharacterized protein n=1 Tax=Setaria digitata TaxID=48799 RepID=A0A915PSK4_9BILA
MGEELFCLPETDDRGGELKPGRGARLKQLRTASHPNRYRTRHANTDTEGPMLPPAVGAIGGDKGRHVDECLEGGG